MRTSKQGLVDNELEHWALDSGYVADNMRMMDDKDSDDDKDWDVQVGFADGFGVLDATR